MFRYTSLLPRGRPSRRSSTAMISSSRLKSKPAASRRGLPRVEGVTRACISRSMGLLPWMTLHTALPGWAALRSERK